MTPAAVLPKPGDVMGQPRGLSFLSGWVFWEAFGFYGPQALLLLYMVEHLLLPGHIEAVAGFAAFRSMVESVTGPLSSQALGAQIFGLYVGLARFTPVFGGLIGDRWLGRRRAVLLGSLLLAAGFFALAVEALFLLGLVLVILGSGFASANVQSQVGALYARDDRRRDDGFQIYYLLLNLGAFVAPLLAGWVAQAWDWQSAFVIAGAGVGVAVLVYLCGTPHLPADAPRAARANLPKLTGLERRATGVLMALVPVMALFWVAQSQVWNVYNLWVRDHVDLALWGWSMPVPWLQALDALAPALLVPPILALWRWQAVARKAP